MLAAIRDACDDADDGPRRAYADWLIERGDARGIYLQRALAPGAPDPIADEQAWEAALLPAAQEACAAWEACLGPGFELAPDDFERGLPSRVSFDGALRELPARASSLVAMTAQALVVETDDHQVVVRRDGRVVATVWWRDWPGAAVPEMTARVRVHGFPSLDVIAERAHRYRSFAPRIGAPRDLRFARDEDALVYAVDERTETLRFAVPPAAAEPGTL